MDRDTVHLSRVMSHALRHAPGRYGLTLDAEGWVPVEDLLAGLGRHRSAWGALAPVHIERLIERSDKPRFEVRDGRIRARYGHSVPVRAVRERTRPPRLLYHGTTPQAAAKILVEGLRPMSRQHVHLSVDEQTARQVGARRSRHPVVLTVRAAAAHEAGVAFYKGHEQIWLADHVPPEFVAAPNDRDAFLLDGSQ